MKDKKTFNINDYVYIKLTEYGKELYYNRDVKLNESYGREIIPPKHPEVDSEGYTKMQMWEFISLYGEHTSVGCILPFEVEMQFEEKDLK